MNTTDQFYSANTYAKQHRVEGIQPATPDAVYDAQVIVNHRAPDLYGMIFGSENRPMMNRPRLRLA